MESYNEDDSCLSEILALIQEIGTKEDMVSLLTVALIVRVGKVTFKM